MRPPISGAFASGGCSAIATIERSMTKSEILEALLEVAVVPVIRTSTADGAVRSVEALYAGGITAAEITMTVPGAIRALEKVADKFGGKIVLGAGTVLDSETARACMLAGAEFFVTPSLKLSTIEMVKRYPKVMPRRADAYRSARR